MKKNILPILGLLALSQASIYSQDAPNISSYQAPPPTAFHLEEDFVLPLPDFQFNRGREARESNLPEWMPEEMENVRSISYFGPESPDKYIIHIRQSKLPNYDYVIGLLDNLNPTATDSSEEATDRANRRRELIADINNIATVQNEIISIIEQLRTYDITDTIYIEGRYTEVEQNTLLSQDEILAQPMTYQEKHLQIRNEESQFYFEGTIFAYANYLINLKPAEQEDTYKQGGLIYNNLDSDLPIPDIKQFIFEARENALLENVIHYQDTIGATVYGSLHSWRNNIESWNESNPNETFGLIEITPEDLQEDISLEYMINNQNF